MVVEQIMTVSSNDGGSVFLQVECGDFIAIAPSEEHPARWWVGQVLSKVGNSIDPSINSLFQVIDIDTGIIKIVNADYVRGIVWHNSK